MDKFDPYHKWLGIPPKEQPPNHYRLLGIALFEDDPEVIEAAADQRMAFVRQLASGQHKVVSQQLLNELARARLCLLNGIQRQRYNEGLRCQLSEDQAPAIAMSKRSTNQDARRPTGKGDTVQTVAEQKQRIQAREPKQTRSSRWLWKFCVASVSVLLVGIGLFWRGADTLNRMPAESTMSTTDSTEVQLRKSEPQSGNSPSLMSVDNTNDWSQRPKTIPRSSLTVSAAGGAAANDVVLPSAMQVPTGTRPTATALANQPGNLKSPALSPHPIQSAEAFDSASIGTEPVPVQVATPGSKPGDEWIAPTIGLSMCWCPPGSPPPVLADDDSVRRGGNELALSDLAGFYQSKYEITQEQFAAVMQWQPSAFPQASYYRQWSENALPSGFGAGTAHPHGKQFPEFQGFPIGASSMTMGQAGRSWQARGGSIDLTAVDCGRFPVECVSAFEAVEFCRRLTEKERRSGSIGSDWEFRLPTVAEWTFACLSGTNAAYAFGPNLTWNQANCGMSPSELLNQLDGNSGSGLGRAVPEAPPRGSLWMRPIPVGQYAPNRWGIHDMHGNVAEWCTVAASTQQTEDFRTCGGGWMDRPDECSVYVRRQHFPSYVNLDVGFRVVLSRCVVAAGPDAATTGESKFRLQQGHGDSTVVPLTAGRYPGDKSSIDGIKLALRWCPPIDEATFKGPWFKFNSAALKNGDGTHREEPRTTSSQGYWIAAFEVTEGQFRAVMNFSDTQWQASKGYVQRTQTAGPNSADMPVHKVIWDVCIEFCRRLTHIERQAGRLTTEWEFSLPTQQQWHWALKAGRDFADVVGEEITSQDANLLQVGCPLRLVKGGAYPPNPWGICDLRGNVSEWGRDVLGASGRCVVSGDAFNQRPPKRESMLRSGCIAGFATAWERHTGIGFRIIAMPVVKSEAADTQRLSGK